MPSSSRKVDEIDRADVGIRPYGRSKPLPYKTYFAFLFIFITRRVATAPSTAAAAMQIIKILPFATMDAIGDGSLSAGAFSFSHFAGRYPELLYKRFREGIS